MRFAIGTRLASLQNYSVFCRPCDSILEKTSHRVPKPPRPAPQAGHSAMLGLQCLGDAVGSAVRQAAHRRFIPERRRLPHLRYHER